MPELFVTEGTAGVLKTFDPRQFLHEGNPIDLGQMWEPSVVGISDTGSALLIVDPRLLWSGQIVQQKSLGRWFQEAPISAAVHPFQSPSADDEKAARAQGLKEYLDLCLSRGAISAAVNRAAWRMWLKMNARLDGRLEVPDACPGSAGEILLTWDKGAEHFELEVEQNLIATFFYVIRNGKASWELATKPNDPIDRAVEEVLRRFEIQVPVSNARSSKTGSWIRFSAADASGLHNAQRLFGET